ncbi:diguanylate cyclase [Vibrio sp. JPW-9-11-11]|uniref:sensor domain-containing diguanylate cyclase n=1 Tax=Vibrio sp. JPW-9-11-11 TaxID=1416532 RepID=UPI0015936C6A|nr:sensor domain-containing diguanylate cyclase [Vibrio sp. JPW-9-11-11]NVD08046.1 diguanylate cyclase [Vibrio sp. JPW-9-11-11]
MKEYLDRIKRLEQENQQLKKDNARLQEKLNVALDGNGLCLWEQHVPSGTLTIFNMQWGKMLGYQPHELTATVETWKNNLHPDDYDLAVGAFEDHIAGKTDLYQVVHRMVHKDGSDSWVSDRGRIVEYDNDGNPLRMMGTHIDITQEKRYEQQLAKLANSDPLTGLLNRSAIEQAFYEQQQHSRPDAIQALVFVDIDNFKSVNDDLGHHAGDRLLITIADKLKHLCPNDVQIGRLGGDEFVILSHSLSQNALMMLCDNLLTDTEPHSLDARQQSQIGFSIGVCFYQGLTHRFEDIYQQADSAMYQVKKNGKHGVTVVDLTTSATRAYLTE